MFSEMRRDRRSASKLSRVKLFTDDERGKASLSCHSLAQGISYNCVQKAIPSIIHPSNYMLYERADSGFCSPNVQLQFNLQHHCKLLKSRPLCNYFDEYETYVQQLSQDVCTAIRTLLGNSAFLLGNFKIKTII